MITKDQIIEYLEEAEKYRQTLKEVREMIKTNLDVDWSLADATIEFEAIFNHINSSVGEYLKRDLPRL